MLKQPISIVHYTNVAIVRLKVNKDKFEVACFKNKIKQYREKIETDISEVLQVSEIFTNSIKGEKANKKLLNKYFPNMSNEEIIDLILNKGDIQISEKERESDLANTKNDIASIICEKTFDLNTGKPFSQNSIISTINKLGINIKETEDPKKQALKIIKQLLESQTLNIERRYMKLSFRIKKIDEKNNKKSNVMIDDEIFEYNEVKNEKKEKDKEYKELKNKNDIKDSKNKNDNKDSKNKKNDKKAKLNIEENFNKSHKKSENKESENKENLDKNNEIDNEDIKQIKISNKKKKKGKNKKKKYDSSSESDDDNKEDENSDKLNQLNENKKSIIDDNSELEENSNDVDDIQNKINNYKMKKEIQNIKKNEIEKVEDHKEIKKIYDKENNSTKAINDCNNENEDIYVKEFSDLIKYLESINGKIINKNDFLLIKPVSIISNSDSKEINDEDIQKINHNVKVTQMLEDVMKMSLVCLVSPNFYREMAYKFDSSKIIF